MIELSQGEVLNFKGGYKDYLEQKNPTAPSKRERERQATQTPKARRGVVSQRGQGKAKTQRGSKRAIVRDESPKQKKSLYYPQYADSIATRTKIFYQFGRYHL